MKIKLDNWRDQRGSELEQAKKVVADRNTSLINLSKLTHIPYQTLRNYRSNIDDIDKASWKRINVLAQAWDINIVQNTTSQRDVKEFLKYLSKMFDNWLMDSAKNKKKLAIIKRMRTIILSDPVAVAELFKAEKKS